MAAGPFVDPLATRLPSGKKVPHVWVEGGAVATTASPESVRIDDTGTYQYFGYAAIGSSDASAVWKISRLTSANPQSLLWADGDASYDNVWANRASLTYG